MIFNNAKLAALGLCAAMLLAAPAAAQSQSSIDEAEWKQIQGFLDKFNHSLRAAVCDISKRERVIYRRDVGAVDVPVRDLVTYTYLRSKLGKIETLNFSARISDLDLHQLPPEYTSGDCTAIELTCHISAPDCVTVETTGPRGARRSLQNYVEVILPTPSHKKTFSELFGVVAKAMR